jgi:hypothetical protein
MDVNGDRVKVSLASVGIGANRRDARDEKPKGRSSPLPVPKGRASEDTKSREPMWQSYLPEVDAVLEAALSAEEWARIRSEGP